MRRLMLLAFMLLSLPVAAQTFQAAVVTPWTGAGTAGNPYRPKLATEYPAVTWDDITGQTTGQLIPAPNAYTLLVRCDGATLDTIEDDTDYVVLWTEELPTDIGQATRTDHSWLDALLSVLGPREAWAAQPSINRAKAARPKKALPPAAEKAKLKTDLKRLGYSTAAAKALIRDGVARVVIQGDIVAAQKVAPKA